MALHKERADILTPATYDDDASPFHSQSSEFEDEEATLHDEEILKEDEEREKLLAEHSSRALPKRLNVVNAEKEQRQWQRDGRSVRKAKRRARKEYINRDGGAMYEMEEGGTRSDISSRSSRESVVLDLKKSNHDRNRHPKRSRSLVGPFITLVISILFCLLIFGAYRASHKTSKSLPLSLLSNGSSKFLPTTILISLDGFRADFLKRGLTPTLSSFIAEGISPEYMLPSFPSVTFPNHYTLVTGLYPESHGVVGNSFWDAQFEEDFFYTDPAKSMQEKWWLGGEPIWVTAEKLGVRTAIHMWPGSEAHIQLEPTFLDKFNSSEALSGKVNRILQLIDLPGEWDTPRDIADFRPQLLAAYVPNVDADGHKYGPNSTEIRATISNVDTMLHDLFAGLASRNLTGIVNVIIVSDHGMATTSTDRLIQLDNIVDLSLIERIDGWPLYGLRPKDDRDLRRLYDRLREESKNNNAFEVYLRDENMPARYHFSNNDRIAPLWVIPKTGWAILRKEDFDVEAAKARGDVYHPRGLHGYDHEHPLMRAIFVARGPAFPHEANSRVEVFQNTEVYNMVCDSLGIKPKPNNGTLRLPLKPVGFHSQDSGVNEPGFLSEVTVQSLSKPTATHTSQEVSSAQPFLPIISENTGVIVDDADQVQGEHKSSPSTGWWASLMEKLNAAKLWLSQAIANRNTNDTSE